jgi:hypothetical protein
MRHHPKNWLVPALALVVCSVTAAAPLPPRPMTPEKAAQNAILDLASKLDTTDFSALAQKIVKEHDSEDISSIFRMKRRGGLGTGILPEDKDGIERLVQAWSRKAPSKEEVDRYQWELLRTANAIRAMSELAPYRLALRPTKSPQENKERQEVLVEFKSAALAFRDAVVEKDPARVKTALTQLNNTCCHCHGLVDR